MEFEFEISGRIHRIGVDVEGKTYYARLGERRRAVDMVRVSPNAISMIVDGAATTVYLATDGIRSFLTVGGEVYSVQAAETVKKSEGKDILKEEEAITTPMPGLVVKLPVKEGEVVEEGQVVAIVEAMKMENSVRAPMKSTVTRVRASEGDKVEFGAVLVELKRV